MPSASTLTTESYTGEYVDGYSWPNLCGSFFSDTHSTGNLARAQVKCEMDRLNRGSAMMRTIKLGALDS
jgi:hypothetical protein